MNHLLRQDRIGVTKEQLTTIVHQATIVHHATTVVVKTDQANKKEHDMLNLFQVLSIIESKMIKDLGCAMVSKNAPDGKRINNYLLIYLIEPVRGSND